MEGSRQKADRKGPGGNPKIGLGKNEGEVVRKETKYGKRNSGSGGEGGVVLEGRRGLSRPNKCE